MKEADNNQAEQIRNFYKAFHEKRFKKRKGRKAERICMMKDQKIAKQIGANIRRIRMEHGETQSELGEYLGYTATAVANYESGFRLPDLVTFVMIAGHYGVPLDAFLAEEPRKP